MILTEDKVMDRLYELAGIASLSSPVSGARLAAMIEYKGRVISAETNTYKTDPFAVRFQKNPKALSLHAETRAIKRALYYLNPDEIEKSILYVCRVKKNGSWGLSRCCQGCQSCIEMFNIKEVYYSTENGYARL